MSYPLSKFKDLFQEHPAVPLEQTFGLILTDASPGRHQAWSFIRTARRRVRDRVRTEKRYRLRGLYLSEPGVPSEP